MNLFCRIKIKKITKQTQTKKDKNTVIIDTK